MNELPEIVSKAQWMDERLALLDMEKALTRAQDALNAERRRLPMVRVNKQYLFETENGPASLLDLFEGRDQLIVHHFMFAPEWNAPAVQVLPMGLATLGNCMRAIPAWWQSRARLWLNSLSLKSAWVGNSLGFSLKARTLILHFTQRLMTRWNRCCCISSLKRNWRKPGHLGPKTIPSPGRQISMARRCRGSVCF